MKRSLKFLLVALFAFIPTMIKADVDNFVASFDDTEIEETVNGSSVIAGDNVKSSNTINGVNMLFGNNIKYDGLSDYALFAGNNINVDGIVSNDGAIFGNNITFDGSFVGKRDLFIAGNMVVLNGKIERDITIFADTVILDNVFIKGNAAIKTANLEIKKDTVIDGKLSYYENTNLTMSDEATIADVIKLDAVEKHDIMINKVYAKLTLYAMIIVTFVGLGLIVPGLFKRISHKYENFEIIDLFSTLGFGALTFIGVPMISVLLMVTILGLPLGLLMLAFYIIVLLLTNIFAGYFIGDIICKKIIKKDLHYLLAGLIGISVISLLALVPILGDYIVIISIMLSLGVVVKLFKKD